MTRASMRHAWWLLPLTGCNAALGIDELPKADTTATFKYAADECASCVETHCASEQSACARNPGCAAENGCIARVARNDLAGRAKCYDEFDLALNAEPGAALDQCRRTHCLEQCLGPGGLVTTEGEECQHCVDNDPTCRENLRACFESQSCERKAAAFVACKDPDCRFRVLSQDYPPPADQDAEVDQRMSKVRECLSNRCDGDCGLSKDFGCAGGYEWEHGPVTLVSVTMHANVGYVDLYQGDHLSGPAAGAELRVCANTHDVPGCAAPPPLGVPADGVLDLDLPLVSGQFIGDVFVDGGAAYPTHNYFGRPIISDQRDFTIPVVSNTTVADIEHLYGALVPGLGHLGVLVHSCWAMRTSSVEFSLDLGAETGSTATAAAGGYWVALNINPGLRKITGRVGDRVVVEYTLPVEEDAATLLSLFPATKSP